MRIYKKPELKIEFFEVEDIITISAVIEEPEETFTDPDITVPDVSVPDEPATDPVETTTDRPGTTREPVIFEEEVMGGNPVQEVLNNLYDNFVEIF